MRAETSTLVSFGVALLDSQALECQRLFSRSQRIAIVYRL